MTRPLTDEAMRARFNAHTRPADGGHLTWTGPYTTHWHGHKWHPTALAFYLRTGRRPDGNALPDCEHPHCVQPDHVDDENGRQRIRQQIRAIRGLPPPAPVCRRGHDQTIHGDLTPNGIAHCAACTKQRRGGATA
jgi:hypothetical protein